MIPPDLALVAWLVIGTFLMAHKNPAVGFTLNMMLPLMFLPTGHVLDVAIIPKMGKADMALLAALAGTVMFHPNLLFRYRPRWFDIIIVVVILFTVNTSIVNGHGLYDGLANAFGDAMGFIVFFGLCRIILATPAALRTSMVVVVWMSVIYAPLALWEWRMSPQIHTTLYGYFQHSFIQHARGGFWRPVVCFSHGLHLGRFFAFTAFVAMFPLRSVLARQVSGGQYLFVFPLLGLLLSMSFGPYLLFAGLCAFYVILKRWLWFAYALPAAAAVWMAMMLLGMNPMYGMVDIFATISVDRAESFRYRIDALNEYRINILAQPIFGWGGWGNARITGRATDSVFMTRALSRGLVGAVIIYSYYYIMLWVVLDCLKRVRGTPIAPDVRAIASIMPFAIALCAVDQGLDTHVLMFAAACIGLQVYLKRMGPNLALAARQRAVKLKRAALAARMAYHSPPGGGGSRIR